MSAAILRPLLLFASCIVCAQGHAGVGATSSGVNTNTPTSLAPSASVQDQSSGFVQQNQQAQQNAASPNGIAVPSSATGTSGTAAANAANAGQRNGAAPDASGKPGDPQKPGDPAAAAAPAAPPPPPPAYVSVVKHLKPGTSDTATTVETAPMATTATDTPPPAPAQQPKTDPPPAAPAPVATPTLAPRAPPAARTAATDPGAEKHPAANHVAAATAVTGGSGEAPDGITFYLGLGIAMALLGVALAAYLRSQRDDVARRSGT